MANRPTRPKRPRMKSPLESKNYAQFQKRYAKQTKLQKRGILKQQLILETPISRRTQLVTPAGRGSFMAAPQPGMPQTPQNLIMQSTAIARLQYNVKKEELIVHFVKGGSYIYFGVPAWKVQQFADAPSKGRYFYYNIRTNYSYTRLS